MNKIIRIVLSLIFWRPYLDKFISNIENEDDKDLFLEACKSVSIGAYRATYIMIWVSCIESIKRKFKKLNRNNDPKAMEVIEEVKRRENEEEAVDDYLIREANNYGFLSDIEVKRLRNIYENRSIFAHPYEETPSKESILSASKEVTDYVLSQKTALGKSFVDKEIDKLIQEHHFLGNQEHPIERYSEKLVSKINKDHFFYFMEELWKRLQEVNNSNNMIIVNRGITFSKKFLSKIEAELIDDHDFSDVIIDTQQISPFVLVHPSIFPVLNDRSQDQVINILISKSKGDDNLRISNLEILEKIGTLIEYDHLGDHLLLKFNERLDDLPRGELRSSSLGTKL